jgi:hypothetical protein
MKGSSSDQLQAKLEIMEFDLANIAVKLMDKTSLIWSSSLVG